MSDFEKTSTTAERIKDALGNRKMKATELSKLTGIDNGSISHYLSGNYEPKQMAIYKMAKALNVSEMWLWGYNCPMERPAEQQENDELADLVERLKNEKDFRQLILQISHLKSGQLDVIKNVLLAFTQNY